MSETNGTNAASLADREITTRGRILKIRCLSAGEANAVHRAITQDGVVQTLEAVGNMASLTPAQKRLALVLTGEEL